MMNQSQVNQLCEDNELAFFRADDATRALERRRVSLETAIEALEVVGYKVYQGNDGAYDRPFLINKDVAPFLVDVSTGKYPHDETGYFYYAWDEQKGEAVRVEPHSYDLQVDATALEGTYEVDGTTCKTAFLMLVEHLQDYTPEFQETVTGLPAADCVELARELEKADAIFYDIAYGMRYRNQGEIHRAVTLLSMLTGSVGKPGAGCGYPMAMN